METVFNAIKLVITTAWEAIKAIFTTVLNLIKTLVTTHFNVVKTIIQNVMTTIQTIISTVWTAIQTVITTVLTAIQTIFSTIWNAIKSIVTSVVSAIKSFIIGDFEGVRASISSIMSTIQSTISTVWNTISSTVSTVVTTIKTTVLNIFQSIDKIELFGAGLAPSMVRRMHTLCRAALEKAVEDGFIRKNPSLDCKLPPKKGTEMQVLSVEEMQRFLIQAKYDGFFELYLTELTTGLRIGELLALRWDDINFRTGAVNLFKQATMARGKMQITTPKTQSSIRTVYLSKPVLEALKEYQKTVDGQH